MRLIGCRAATVLTLAKLRKLTLNLDQLMQAGHLRTHSLRPAVRRPGERTHIRVYLLIDVVDALTHDFIKEFLSISSAASLITRRQLALR